MPSARLRAWLAVMGGGLVEKWPMLAASATKAEFPVAVKVSLAKSYQLCGQVARRAASNFYWSFWLLPAAQRQAMCALYAFSRHTDDLGDSDEPLDVRAAQLHAWRQSLAAALAGGESDPLLPAVADAVTRFSIPPKHLYAVIDGVERDLRPERFETKADLLAYCHNVASAVGLSCLHIWSDQPRAAYDAARDCGVAFQLTNILRDLREDAARGRVYFPEEDLRAFGVSRAQVLAGQASDELVGLLQFQVARAEGYYARGWETRRFLTAGPRRAFDLMFRTYHELLTQIRQQPLAVLRRRLRLNSGRKLWIAAATCMGQAPPRPITNSRTPASAAEVPSPTPP